MLETNLISSALSNYLETIYLISLKKNSVRISDISRFLKISKPSVNRAVNTLMERGLVSHEPYGDIILTEDGEYLAKNIYSRHSLIKQFLTDILLMEEKDADKEAHNMGNSISQLTIDKMQSYIMANAG